MAVEREALEQLIECPICLSIICEPVSVIYTVSILLTPAFVLPFSVLSP
jgi:hypothetical protein